ncbi:MAG: formylglycine-generating enzyme family protein [Geobacteraceae bacterium]
MKLLRCIVTFMSLFFTIIQPLQAVEVKDAGKVISGNGGSIDPITGMGFIPVPSGCFRMGDSFGDGAFNEKPLHEVCLEGFSIGKYEVTQGQWKKIMGSNPSSFTKCGDDCPVENVGWDDMLEFIRRFNSRSGLNSRLPTEAEWEYAARSGGRTERYSGGQNISDVGWYSANADKATHPVGQKRPNGLGIYDMSGNVCEWVSDWYGSGYYGESPQNNPQGPSSGGERVIRGGSWYDGQRGVRAFDRGNFAPGSSGGYLGLRLLLPVTSTSILPKSGE